MVNMPIRFTGSNSSEMDDAKSKLKSFLPTSKHHRSTVSSSSSSSNQPNNTYNYNTQGSTRTSYSHSHSQSTSTSTSRSSTNNTNYTTFNISPHQTNPMHHHTRPVPAVTTDLITPTSSIAEWAHQTHLAQRRSYWWCTGCHPPRPADPLEIPRAVEKMIESRRQQRRVRVIEPDSAYD